MRGFIENLVDRAGGLLINVRGGCLGTHHGRPSKVAIYVQLVSSRVDVKARRLTVIAEIDVAPINPDRDFPGLPYPIIALVCSPRFWRGEPGAGGAIVNIRPTRLDLSHQPVDSRAIFASIGTAATQEH